MATFTSASYDGRYLQLSISESVDVANNKSTLTWTLTSAGGASSYYTIDDTTVSINGTQVYYKARTAWDDRVFPAAKGSVSGTIDVTHNSNGTKSVTVVFMTRVYVYGSVDYGGTMTLTAIDRTAPTVSCSVSNITANSFKITATSSATADLWDYSLDDGISATPFSTTAGTSASTTVTGLSPNTTYYVRVGVRKKSNQVYGESSSVTVKTLGGAIINSCPTITVDAATVTFKPNVTVYDASFSCYLSIWNGSTEYLALSARTWSKGTADRTITLSQTERADLLDAMASIKSFTATIKVVTKSGTTQIGSTSTTTCTVQTTEANSAPSLTSFTYYDGRSATTTITGDNQKIIQSYSYLYVTPGTATAKNSATIVKYAASCNGVTVSNTTGAVINLGAVTKSGALDVVVTVTDSRGYTKSVTQSVTVMAYAKPKVSSISLRRTNDIEAEMQLIFSGSISSIMVGSTEKNSLKYVRYRYKLTSATSYGSYTSILSSVTTSGNSFSFSNLELLNLDANSSYDFHLQIQDALTSYSSTDIYFVVSQGTPLIALRKKKIGINTPNPDAALHVVGDGHFEGDVHIDGNITADNLNLDNDVDVPPFYYGTCSTAAATVAKVVTCSGFVLETGATIVVKFTNYNTGSSATLNVNSTGAKSIKMYGTTATNTYMWRSGEAVLFVYDGSYWQMVGMGTATTTYYGLTKLSSSTSSTSTTVAATASAVKAAYDRNSWESISLDTALALADGGTGATTAAAARTNLGITATSLYNGTLSSGSTTFNYGNYNFYVIIGKPASSVSSMSIVIPKAALTTSVVKYQFADEAYYITFGLSYSGSTVTLTWSSSNGSGVINRVFGIN
jgi:hypothetical protein|nr:MAG TPA: protein of unknown function DUF859 [Caudoviricetes sp.]